MFVPVIVSLLVGQDSLILLAAITGVFLLLESRRPFLAGLLLALLWVKLQFLPPFLLLLVIRKEWRAVAGVATASALILLPVVAQVRLYAAALPQIAGRPDVMPCRECMPNLYAFIPSLSVAAFVSAVLMLVSGTQFRRRPLADAFALTAVTALLASMHAHGYDCGLLFLAVTLAVPLRGPLPRTLLAGWALSPLPYLLPYFGSGAWSVPAHLLPAVTATLLWLTLFSSFSSARTPSGSDESSPAPDGYQTA
jgi:hypothetical protein